MLPLKTKPLVIHTQQTSIEIFHKLLDALTKEPVCNSRIFNGSTIATRPVVSIVRTSQACKVCLLHISSTVGEEDCGQP